MFCSSLSKVTLISSYDSSQNTIQFFGVRSSRPWPAQCGSRKSSSVSAGTDRTLGFRYAKLTLDRLAALGAASDSTNETLREHPLSIERPIAMIRFSCRRKHSPGSLTSRIPRLRRTLQVNGRRNPRNHGHIDQFIANRQTLVRNYVQRNHVHCKLALISTGSMSRPRQTSTQQSVAIPRLQSSHIDRTRCMQVRTFRLVQHPTFFSRK